jgi:hypothetical protein
MKRVHFTLIALSLGTAMGLFSGCNPNTAITPNSTLPNDAAKPTSNEDHEHEPGLHGGNIVELSGHNYHIEAVFEKGGVLRLFTYGKNEEVPYQVEVQTLKAYAKFDGETEATPFELEAKPQEGDDPNTTTQFVGQLPAAAVGKSVDVSIPTFRIGKERFRVAFQNAVKHADHDMPGKVADSEEAKLYLTPDGKYTTEDIKANGNVLPSVKFKGMKSDHNAMPVAGDKICPISKTKANPAFAWTINGEVYTVCCPPCLDELVQLAKDKPAELLPPGEYVQK